jgi:hypothetical protein
MAEHLDHIDEVQPTEGRPRSGMHSICAELRQATAKMLADSRLGASPGPLLNAFLRRYLAWPYRATPGRALDCTAVESPEFGSLVYTSSENLDRVPADALACAIDAHQILGLEELRASYAKIAQTKKLAKSPPPKTSDTPIADATMGIIFALDSNVPLETLAEELEQLNKQESHRYWVDMVVVVARGTIHYICQFPHQPLGVFLPPARDAFVSAAMYVHIFARPHAEFSLNRLCGVLFPYLYFFSPGVSLPPYQQILEGVPNTGMTIAPYQANLKGDLVPVPTELKFNRFFLFPLGFSVEDRTGELLGKVQYLPWQDGGVVRVIGKLPIEGLLIFAGADALKQPVVRIGGEQISGVIPLSRQQFIEMAERTANRSNLVIKPDERPKWVVEKHGDEGTTSPFVARLYMGILRLRDLALSEATEREQFDKAFQGVIAALESIRAAAKTVVELYSSHSERVAQGEIARVRGDIVFLDENIDRELRKQTEIVISTAGRVVKDRMQEVLRTLSLDIGFFYKKPSTFANGIAKLKQQDISLATYLEQTRLKWSERLKNCRDALEHESWVLPKIAHEAHLGSVRSIEPLVDGQPVTLFVSHIVDRTCCLIEELCAYALQRRMPEGISFAEIPLNERKPEIVERFRPALIGSGMPIWTISYHGSKFEET